MSPPIFKTNRTPFWGTFLLANFSAATAVAANLDYALAVKAFVFIIHEQGIPFRKLILCALCVFVVIVVT